MGSGIYINTLYLPIWRIDMQGMHRDTNSKSENSRLMECLKICVDSLDEYFSAAILYNSSLSKG